MKILAQIHHNFQRVRLKESCFSGIPTPSPVVVQVSQGFFKPQSAVFNRDLQIQTVSRKSGINRKLNTGRLRSCASNASSTTQNGLTTTEKNPILCDLPNSYSISTKKRAKKGGFFGQKRSKMLKKSPDINFS